MSTLLLALMLTASVDDPRGFHFAVPGGFEPFPGFQPTATAERPGKLYAFARDLGTPDAVVIAIDVLEGPSTAGAASRSCGALMHSIDRTVGKPIAQRWQGEELSGLRMVMTHAFGEVVVYCVDVPLLPNALSVMVSGKPAHEAFLLETFHAVLGSLAGPRAEEPFNTPLLVVFALVIAGFLVLGWRARAHR